MSTKIPDGLQVEADLAGVLLAAFNGGQEGLGGLDRIKDLGRVPRRCRALSKTETNLSYRRDNEGVTRPKTWTVILEPCEEGGFTSTIAEYPYVVSEGKTEEEATAMVLDALAESLAYDREKALSERTPQALLRSA